MNLILRQTSLLIEALSVDEPDIEEISLLIGALSVDEPDIEANQPVDRIPNNGPRTGHGSLNDRFVYVQCTNI